MSEENNLQSVVLPPVLPPFEEDEGMRSDSVGHDIPFNTESDISLAKSYEEPTIQPPVVSSELTETTDMPPFSLTKDTDTSDKHLYHHNRQIIADNRWIVCSMPL